MTTLSGPVGLRNRITPVQNDKIDQGKVTELLWSINPESGGMKGVSTAPATQPSLQCSPELAAAILAFQALWVARGEFRAADGVVDRGGRTLRKLDLLASGGAPPTPVEQAFTDLKVLSFQQTEPITSAVALSIPAIEPGSVMPFLFGPGFAKNNTLVEGSAVGTATQFLFKIKKNGKIFWVGASVPEGTSDFSRAHIFFHPNTKGPEGYTNFSSGWPDVKQKYLVGLGLHMASVKQMVLIVPFTPLVSDISPTCPLFADRGLDTLNDILTAIGISLGRQDPVGSIQQIGVSSYSSGIALLYSFAQSIGSTGLIREQIDFDSAFIIKAHKRAQLLPNVTNWMVTQSAPPFANQLGWLHLPPSAFKKVFSWGGDVHSQIGLMMFKTMMTVSVMP
ncbi:MAG: hypothetical protein ABI878_14130 [Acidobacteriota bacterium]